MEVWDLVVRSVIIESLLLFLQYNTALYCYTLALYYRAHSTEQHSTAIHNPNPTKYSTIKYTL